MPVYEQIITAVVVQTVQTVAGTASDIELAAKVAAGSGGWVLIAGDPPDVGQAAYDTRYLRQIGGTLGGPLTISTVGGPALADLPLGRAGSANTGLNIIGSFAGGEDEPGGVDYDSSPRANFYVYQRAESTSYAEFLRAFLMKANAKGTIAWYKPRLGYDTGTLDPAGSTWDPVAWLVAHVMSNDDPTLAHNHLSIETPDSTGAIQTRFEIPFGPQGTGVDQTVRGLDHVNLKTNLADLTVRAAGSTSYVGGRIGVLRVAGGNTREKILEFGLDAETGAASAIRWRILANSTTESTGNVGSDFAVRRHADDGTLLGTPLFMQRSTGNVALGQASAETARIAAVWGTSGHHGFYAKPSATPGSGAAFAALLTATTDRLIGLQVGAEAVSRLVVFGDGKVEWGDGALTRDTNLYRTAADTLKTDDSLHVGATLRHLGSSAGFFNAAAVTKPTVTGSKASGAALTSLLAALVSLGLITDSTSA